MKRINSRYYCSTTVLESECQDKNKEKSKVRIDVEMEIYNRDILTGSANRTQLRGSL